MSKRTPQDILGANGALADFVEQYEARPQQLAMSEAVADAIANKEHAIVEAPTGVGKSFAYLVPAILHAKKTGAKVVISTGTIALQEQLIHKDLPMLQKVFPILIPYWLKAVKITLVFGG